MHAEGLVDISGELAGLGLLTDFVENRGFVVRLVQEGSAAAECGRVAHGDVLTEFNSVSIQPLAHLPAVRKHGVRPDCKFAFLRLLKDDGLYVECAIERGGPAAAMRETVQVNRQSIESKAIIHKETLPGNGIPTSFTDVSIGRLLRSGFSEHTNGERSCMRLL